MENHLNKRLSELEEQTNHRETMAQGFFHDLWRAYGDPDSPPPGPVNLTAKAFVSMLKAAIKKAYGKT